MGKDWPDSAKGAADARGDADDLRMRLELAKTQISSLEQENATLRRANMKAECMVLQREKELQQKARSLKDMLEFKEGESMMFSTAFPIGEGASMPKRVVAAEYINRILEQPKAFSYETLKELRLLKQYFYEDFNTIKIDRILETLDKDKLAGGVFAEMFSLFCDRKEVFDAHWEYFYSIPGCVCEKHQVLIDAPLDWILDAYDRPSETAYSAPGSPNGLRRFITASLHILHDFLILVLRKRPKFIHRLIDRSFVDRTVKSAERMPRLFIKELLRNSEHSLITGDAMCTYSSVELLRAFPGTVVCTDPFDEVSSEEADRIMAQEDKREEEIRQQKMMVLTNLEWANSQ